MLSYIKVNTGMHSDLGAFHSKPSVYHGTNLTTPKQFTLLNTLLHETVLLHNTSWHYDVSFELFVLKKSFIIEGDNQANTAVYHGTQNGSGFFITFFS